MDLVELAKAAGDLRAIGADEQPVHLEQAHLGGVHEQLYRVRLGQVDGTAVLDGIDAKEIIVVGGTDEAFELRENFGAQLLADPSAPRRWRRSPSLTGA